MAIKVSRRSVLSAAAAGTAGLVAGATGFPRILRGRRRLVLVIVVDAMRGDVIGRAVGGSEVTPNINRLAESGICFTQAYSAAPATKFSVASILTGMYPPGHGVEHPRFTLPAESTLSSYLRHKGLGSAAIVTNSYLAPEVGPDFSLAPMGFGFNGPFDYYRYIGVRKGGELEGLPERLRPFRVYAGGEELNAGFASFVKKNPPLRNSSLFVYLHYMDTHQPWVRTAPVAGITGRFHPSGAGPEVVHERDIEVISRLTGDDGRADGVPPEEIEVLNAVYREAAAYADRCIGALFDALRALGVFEDATIILTSDHGEELTEHGFIGHAKNLFNTSLHVPLIVKRPGLEAARIERRVSNAAIMPTIMEWFGDENGDTNVPSLMPYVERGDLGNAEVFASFYGRDKIILPDGRAVMHHDGEYVFFADASGPLDLEATGEDPGVRAALEKCRFASRRLAEEAGVRRRFSTYAWQNPDAPHQERLAGEAVARGEMTAAEAAILRSTGAFLPARSEEELKEEIAINKRDLSDDELRQLRALGYLN